MRVLPCARVRTALMTHSAAAGEEPTWCRGSRHIGGPPRPVLQFGVCDEAEVIDHWILGADLGSDHEVARPFESLLPNRPDKTLIHCQREESGRRVRADPKR